MRATAPALIGGEPYASGGWYETVDPATEAVIAQVADCSSDDVDRAVRLAAEAAPAWAAVPVERRRDALGVAADRLAARRTELIDLAIHDAGARLTVATDTQVDAAIARLLAWSRMPDDALTLPPPDDHGGLRSAVRRMPVGVVACISPYNFPLLAMVGKAAPALFAGNAVVLKPAPQDPLLVVALAEALRDGLAETGAPVSAVGLLTGEAPELGAALVRHPRVGAVSFTGSTAVGVEIYRQAAGTVKRMLLELGGKGACIIRRDADADAVADAVLRTWTVQSGQVCLTPARLLVDEHVYDDLVARLTEHQAKLRMGDPRDPSVDVGPLISAEQRRRVEALVDGAADQGCRVIRAAVPPNRGYFSAPTLVTGCRPEHTIMREEAFGPVLCVMRTRDDDEAVAAANATRYGLYDYVFSADRARARALAGRLASAQVSINTTRRHPDAPFGGNKLSGLGRSGARYALDAYTDIQTLTEPAEGE